MSAKVKNILMVLGILLILAVIGNYFGSMVRDAYMIKACPAQPCMDLGRFSPGGTGACMEPTTGCAGMQGGYGALFQYLTVLAFVVVGLVLYFVIKKFWRKA